MILKHEQNKMIQLAYTTIARRAMDKAALMKLLQQARLFNYQHNLSGILLYKDRSFFQVLEGDNNTVTDLMVSIGLDNRHQDLNVMYNRVITQRDFQTWSMGFVNLDAEELDPDLRAAKDFIFPLQSKSGSLAQIINVSKAKTLVSRFSGVLA